MEEAVHIKIETEDDSGWSLADETDDCSGRGSPVTGGGSFSPLEEDHSDGNPVDLTIVKVEPASPASDDSQENSNIPDEVQDARPVKRFSGSTAPEPVSRAPPHLKLPSSLPNVGKSPAGIFSPHVNQNGMTTDPIAGRFRSYNHDALLQGLVSSNPVIGDTARSSVISPDGSSLREIRSSNHQDGTLLRSILSGGTAALGAPGALTTNSYNPNPGTVSHTSDLSRGAILRTLLSPMVAPTVALGTPAKNSVEPTPGPRTDTGSNIGSGMLLRSLLNSKPVTADLPRTNTGKLEDVSHSNVGDSALSRRLPLAHPVGNNMPGYVSKNLGAVPSKPSNPNSEDYAFSVLMQELFDAQIKEAMISRSILGNANSAQLSIPSEKFEASVRSEAQIDEVVTPASTATEAVESESEVSVIDAVESEPYTAAIGVVESDTAAIGAVESESDTAAIGAVESDTAAIGAVESESDTAAIGAVESESDIAAIGAVESESDVAVSRSRELVNIDDVVELSWDNKHPACTTPCVQPGGAPGFPSTDLDTANPKTEEIEDLEDLPQEVTIFADGTQAPDVTDAPGFKCDLCWKILKTRTTLRKHKKDSCKYRHNAAPKRQGDKFSCDVCSKTLKSEGALLKHKKKKCGRQKEDSRCRICKKRFPKGQTLKHHLLTHEEVERFPCTHCEKLFLTKEQLDWHERLHTQEKAFHCKYCPKSFHAQANLNMHEKIHTDERPFPCQLCGKSFKRKRTLECHIRSHTQEKPFECPTCQKCFPTKTNLRTHQKIHARSERFYCRHCDKSYVTKGGRDVHERVHSGVKPFHCPLCGKRYNHNRSLIDHMKRHSGEKPYRCSFCPKTFALKCNVFKHERVHTGEKPYKCKFCGKLFSQKNHANDHENTHTRKKTFRCEVCDKEFFQRASLYNHKIRHRDVKPFKCQYCEKTFINRLIVTNHERTHTGEKPFQCQYCDKAFNTKGYLVVHEKLHTTAMHKQAAAAAEGDFSDRSEFGKMARPFRKPREKVFKCQYCEKMFCLERNARLHEEREHVIDRIRDPAENEFPIAYPEFDATNPLYRRSLLPLLKELQAKVVSQNTPEESKSDMGDEEKFEDPPEEGMSDGVDEEQSEDLPEESKSDRVNEEQSANLPEKCPVELGEAKGNDSKVGVVMNDSKGGVSLMFR